MISQDIANGIVQRALTASQGETLKTLMQELVDASRELYISGFKRGEYALLQSLPDGWMQKVSSKSYRIRGQWHSLRFANGYEFNVTGIVTPTVGHLERIPQVTDETIFQTRNDAMIQRFIDAETAYEAFKEKTQATFERTVRTVRKLTSLNTLHKEWPELAVYAPAPSIKAPHAVINVSALNAELGIPVNAT